MKADQKKAYQTPKLVTYGDVRVLTTAGTNMGSADNPPANNKTL